MQHSHHHLPNHIAFEFFSQSCWFTSHSAFKNFMQKLATSQNMADPSMFLYQIEFSVCLSFVTLLRTSKLVTLSSQLIFSILLSSTFQRLLIFCMSEKIIEAFEMRIWRKMEGLKISSNIFFRQPSPIPRRRRRDPSAPIFVRGGGSYSV